MSLTVHTGVDVFIIVDGDGTADGAFTLDVTSCTPDCTGAECGTNGCGQLCPQQCPRNIEWGCSTIRTCICEPSCTGRACGSNGCGGSCGTCGTNRACDARGTCVWATLPGDTVASALPITTPSYTYSSTTVGYGNDEIAWGSCGGSDVFWGLDAPDVLFSLAPAQPTTYYVELTSSGFIPALYAVREPADACVAANYRAFTLADQLLVEATASPLYIVVDGDSNGAGPFTLNAHACHVASDCPNASEGQFCSWPHVVGALPFAANDFIGDLDAYSAPAGACGSAHALGEGGRDAVYAFTATTTRSVTARVRGTGQLDPILLVTTNCQSIGSSCIASVDATGQDGTETVTFTATAGTTYFVIVDSFGPLGGQLALTIE